MVFLGYGICGIWSILDMVYIWDVAYLGYGIFGIWYFWDMVYLGYGIFWIWYIFGMWHIWDMVYLGYGIFWIWYIWDMVYLGCGIYLGNDRDIEPRVESATLFCHKQFIHFQQYGTSSAITAGLVMRGCATQFHSREHSGCEDSVRLYAILECVQKKN